MSLAILFRISEKMKFTVKQNFIFALLILFTPLLLCPTALLAEWVQYATNTKGSEYFYDDERIGRFGQSIFVWDRTRYGTKSDLGDWSSQVYQQINCSEFTFKYLQSTYYTDKNWTNKSIKEGKQPKMDIPPDSTLEFLANILCKD